MDHKRRYHSHSINDLYRFLNTSELGLETKEVEERLLKYGKNEISEKDKISFLRIFLRQFKSVLVYILLLAAIISYFTDHKVDAVIILVVILINSLVGFVQEYRAEKAIQTLKKLIIPTAKVIRAGKLLQIRAEELVPGDLMLIEEGDKIPADARIIQAVNLRTLESAITGESLPIDKTAAIIPDNMGVSDQKNMLWLGTLCVNGKAQAIVTATGDKTIIGQVAKQIEEVKDEESHFKIITENLAKQMGLISLIGAIIIFGVGFFIRGFEFQEIFLFSVAALVSSIPEGLPAVLAIVLAMGANSMAKKNAIVRSLPATETLGIVNVIATDKTGTITQNTMTVRKIALIGQKGINTTGEGWSSEGHFFIEDEPIVPLEISELKTILHIASISNSSKVTKDKKGEYEIIGDPTEAALHVLAEKGGLEQEVVLRSEEILYDFPFSNQLKLRATLIEKEGKRYIYVIGAPEAIESRSKALVLKGEGKKLNDEYRKAIQSELKDMAKDAMRVLAFGIKEVDNRKIKEIKEEDLNDFIFIGMVGIIDPSRPEVKDAIAKAKVAGIRVMMLTGDHKETALAIGREVGIADKERHAVITESELALLSEKEFEDAVKTINIFARLTPQTKLRIAKTLQKQGFVVAMTGDGINDAPALKQADVGISMGIIGTDTAREASEIVLADDNFATIVAAIEEGRIAFNNIRRASSYLITTSIAEQLTILITMFLGYPLPLLPTQLLWINLVTDGVADVALSTERSHGTALKDKPRNKNEGILNLDIIIFVVIISVVMMILTIIAFNTYLPQGLEKGRAGAFLVIAFTQLFNMFNYRSFSKSFFKLGIYTNKFVFWGFIASALLAIAAVQLPFLNNILGFQPLENGEILTLFILSSAVLWLGEIVKLFRKIKA